MREARIQVRDMVVRFGDNLVLDRVGFDVFRGEILVVLGGSGCGKSTLLRHVTGLATPESGTVLIDGVDIRRYDIRALRRCFAVVMQDFQHYAFSLAENIALGRPAVLAQDIETAVDAFVLVAKEMKLL